MRYLLPILLLLTLLFTACAGTVVQQGDTVSVTYTGTLQNGSVFDSNDPARQADLPQKPLTAFTPMTVTLGQGRLIPGFEQALIGMKEGEAKTVTIKALDAYGPYKAELVISIPKVIYYNRTAIIHRDLMIPVTTLQAQLTEPIAVGQVIDATSFRYNITAIGPVNATLRIIAVNQTLTLEGDPWPSTVVEQIDDRIILRRDPLDKSLVTLAEGPYVIHLEAERIRLETALQMGQTFGSNYGTGRVTRETDSTLTLDMNHALAGKDLTFLIRVDAVERRE